MKVLRILTISFFLSILLFLLIFKFDFRILNSTKLFFKNFNFQGIECIDNKIYIISNLDHKIYKLSNDNELKEFFDTTLIYKNNYIFSHITSFYIEDNFFYGVNSMDKINGLMLKVPVSIVKSNEKLSNLNYEITYLDTNINHIEFYSKDKNIFIGHYGSTKTNKNILEIKIDGKLLCKIKNKLSIQNLYFDKKTNNIFIISNLLKHYIGIIYKIPIKNICNIKELNFFNIEKKEIIVSSFNEMEGYTECNNKKYFVYINKKDSYIYIE